MVITRTFVLLAASSLVAQEPASPEPVRAKPLEGDARYVEIIDVQGKVDYTDFVVVMSGSSDRQVAALAKHIDREMSQQKLKCSSVEGLPKVVPTRVTTHKEDETWTYSTPASIPKRA